MSTGQRYDEMQFKRVPLNGDAFTLLCQENNKNPKERTEDQEEIIRCSQNVRDVCLTSLLSDFNDVVEDPFTSEQLKTILH